MITMLLCLLKLYKCSRKGVMLN